MEQRQTFPTREQGRAGGEKNVRWLQDGARRRRKLPGTGATDWLDPSVRMETELQGPC